MKSKAALLILKPLLKKPSFTSSEAKSFGVSSETLSYYVKTNEIERVGRGIYRKVKLSTREHFQWQDLVESVQQTKGGIICLLSALALYELTDEIPRLHWIAVLNTTRHRSDSLIKVIRFRNISLGQTTIEINGLILPIFDRERTIIDSFRQLGIETAIKALKTAVSQKGKKRLDLVKLQAYAKKLRFNIDQYLMAVTI